MPGLLGDAAPRDLPHAEQRRRAILEAALRVIADGGVEAVTHRRVAAEARVPLGSTTYYFASRDDLVQEAFRHYLAEVGQALTQLSGSTPPATLAEAVGILVDLTRREFTAPELVLAEYELIVYAARRPALAREFNAWERGIEAQLARALEHLGVHTSFDVARTLISLMRGFELERLTNTAASYEGLRRRLETVLAAFLPQRGASRPPSTAKRRAGASPPARRKGHVG
jgi:DNA-binding transcriptional regulator YbjK